MVVPPEKIGAEKLLHLFGFGQLRELMANICQTKRDVDNRVRALQSTMVFYIVRKFHELWSTSGLYRIGVFTHPHYFVLSQSIAHPLCGINVAPHSDSKRKTALGLSAAQIASGHLKW